jgi:hypothetical protein
MLVKPAPDRKVRDPVTKRHLPEEGKDVPENTYWLRRLAEGDVVKPKQLAESEKAKE